MGLKSSINAAAKAAVLTDTADLQGLVALCELLRQLSSDAASEGKADIAASSSEAADLSEGIVLRQVKDVEAAFQRVLEAINLCDTACEQASAPQREPADPELLTAWVASCEAAIPELEHLTVHAETNGFVGETAADIRRRIHTLKGECGVLSLSEAQSICHDLETLLDSSTDSFPAEAVLAVCDWMKSLANTLAMDQCSNEPDSRAVRATLSPQVAAVTEVIAVVASVTTSSTATASVCAVTDDDGLRDLDSIPADLKVYMNLENADENIGDFALEAREHLANAEAAVLSLEVTPNDAELVNVVFRAFHTIKGVAGFLHLPRIVEVAHASEFLLDKVRSHKIPLTTHVLELVLASSDLLGQLIGMLSGGEPPRERELKVLVRRVEAACEGRVIGAMSSSDSNAPKAAASTLTTPTTSDVKDSLPQDTNSAPIADVVAGRATMSFAVLEPVLPFVKSGHVRALGVVMTNRATQLPEMPTIGETVNGFAISGFNGVCAPSATPKPVIERLNAAIIKVMTNPAVRDRLIKSGSDILERPLPTLEFEVFVRGEVVRWQKIVQDAGVKVN